MRRQRGSATVEFVIILPTVVLLICAITWFQRGWRTELETLHDAETAPWEVAMTNDRGTCGTSERHRFAGVSLGAPGDEAKQRATTAMSAWSFLYVNGGVRRERTRAIPPPIGPIHNPRWTSTTRADYLPCNETIGGNDGTLAGFDDIWQRWASP